MTRWRSSMLVLTVLSVSLARPTAKAHEDEHSRQIASVSFGAGLNTGSGAANQVVLPANVTVRTGGVVNFVVSGPHQIFAYLPGKTPDDVMVPPSGQFIDDTDQLYYGGINPNGAPPPGISNARNRVESVQFSDPGTYLVICNIRSHFLNGMYGFVTVEDPDTTDHDD